MHAPSEPEYLEIGIIAGVPVSINGRDLSPASLLAVAELNEIGGKHGVGRIDMVENRLVGMKSRGVYETPGGIIMAAAVRELEALTLDRETMHAVEGHGRPQVRRAGLLQAAGLIRSGSHLMPSWRR
ncbi:unnamed protein product [Urochloa humidicola]